MRSSTVVLLYTLALGGLLLVVTGSGCPSTAGTGGGNGTPTANAGPDQAVAPGATVTLTGAASSDPDGDTLTFAWVQTGGTAVTLSSATAASPTFTAPNAAATLTFTLTVNDGRGGTATDTVVVTVGGGGGGGTTLTIVKSNIDVRHDAGLKCGNDVIAFGTETAASAIVGVSYVVPSQSPTTGTAVPNSNLYDNSGFAVGGRTIFLAGSPGSALLFQVSVFDVATAAITRTFNANEIRLRSIPVSHHDIGNIQADGRYCIVICDPNSVTDGAMIKVIDVGGATPTLISFLNNPDASAFQIEQVAVDEATHRAIVVADNNFYVYDILNPNAPPAQIVTGNGVGPVQMKVSGDYVIAIDEQSTPVAFLLNLANNTIVDLTDAEATFAVAIGSNTFGFFADHDANDSSGGHQRAAVGTVPGPGFNEAALDDFIDDATTNNGLVGFASTMDIRPDGSYVFLGGWYLQYSAGSASFTVPDDPTGSDPWGTPAWDVDCSSNTLGFKTASSRSGTTDTTLGYAILP